MDKRQHKIIVFSTPSCPWCARVKYYLQTLKIPFKDVDVSRDKIAALEMVRKSNQDGVPQLWIDGRVIVGFDKEKIVRYLNIN